MSIKAPTLKFARNSDDDFIVVLRKRVNNYFADNNIRKHSNASMVFKTVFMVSLLFIPYAFMISGMVTHTGVFLLMWVLMGLGTSGIGLTIMHDANHGSYSKNKTVNRMLSYLLEVVGGSSRNWRIQHNKLHHTYTNVAGMDEDIKANKLFRFAPAQERNSLHRFQFIYAWFFYSIMTLYWVTAKDFMQLTRYRNNGLIDAKDYPRFMAELVAWKVFYFTYLLVLPLIFAPVAGYLVIVGFVILHAISGLALSCIFQPAHVMPSSEYPEPDENGNLENTWAIHQLLTTTNFARGNKLFTWMVGGLNYQVEHHLFPNICHVHYNKISKIVEDTAREYGLPYHFERSYVGALWSHARMLYLLGHKDVVYASS